jgi:hypothetical protein
VQKVKLFKSIESELGVLEKEINTWVADEKIKIISITGNIASQTPGSHIGSQSASDVFVIVLYEDGK